MTKKIKLPHYLHLIKGKGFRMMTLTKAYQYALENNVDVWNVHESIDLKPEYFESEADLDMVVTTNSSIKLPIRK